MTTWQPARVSAWRRPGTLLRRENLRHPVVVATAVAAVLHLLWAFYLAKDSGDMAAQYAWTEFIRAHPSASYNFSWYGGMHPASYSILSPYVMAALGVRTTAVVAGTLSASAGALLLVRGAIRRPMVPVLWTTFALWCDVVSGRVTFALGMLFAVVAAIVLFPVPAGQNLRGRSPRLATAAAMTALATMCSPVAGLFILVLAAALFLTGRRVDAYVLTAVPPLVVGATSLLFPFYGVQPFKWFFAIIPFGIAVVTGLVVPKSWREIRAGSWVYALGVALTWVIPSPIGSNVERLALLFGGTVLLLVARDSSWTGWRLAALWLAFAGTAAWQVTKPIVDQVNTSAVTSTVRSAPPLIAELHKVRADKGRVEVVPLRSHWEAAGLSPHVNLARGWNRQADVERNPLFYDGTLSPATYKAWLERWSVYYVVLPTDEPDGAAVAEAKIVRSAPSWLRPVWRDENWQVFKVDGDVDPLADPPATVVEAGPAELTVSMPGPGSVVLRIPWSPVLGIAGAKDNRHGCLSADGDWTRLYVPAAGTYRIEGTYADIRGTQCSKPETT